MALGIRGFTMPRTKEHQELCWDQLYTKNAFCEQQQLVSYMFFEVYSYIFLSNVLYIA